MKAASRLPRPVLSRLWPVAALALTGALGGCASMAQPGGGSSPQPGPASAAVASAPATAGDPWERFNRRVFDFNEAIDDAVVAPAARAYVAALPKSVRSAVSRVFANVGDAWSAVNHLMQAKPRPALEMAGRFALNSTVGLAGLFDVAADAGLERQREDFGQTLGRWGFGAGPYLVLPLLGPSSLRDALALPLDRRVSLPTLVDDVASRNSLTVLGLLQARAELLSTTGLVQQIALDRYSFVRDSFLARRRSQVWDGNPPPETEDEPDRGEEARPGARR